MFFIRVAKRNRGEKRIVLRVMDPPSGHSNGEASARREQKIHHRRHAGYRESYAGFFLIFAASVAILVTG
jgi:hypothetical protein